MVNRNIQMKKKNDDIWENLFPLTLNENVFNNKGKNLDTQLTDLIDQRDSLIQETKDDLQDDINIAVDNLNTEITNILNRMAQIITPEMTQSEIQQRIDQGGEFKFLKGVYTITLDDNGVGLDIKDNTTISFESGAIFRLEPTILDDYRIINIEKRKDIILDGLTVIGDKHTHLGSGGEWGHGISIRASNNISILNAETNKCWGDGIYIGQATDYSIDHCENIIFENIKADDNRRQGISVTSVKNMYMRNLNLTNTSGTAPEAGIDLEPNNNRNLMQNIIIDGIYTENNSTGVEIHIANFGGTTPQTVSITVNNHISFEDNTGEAIRGYSTIDNTVIRGKIVFNNSLLQNNFYQGISATWLKNKEIMLIFENPKLINPNYRNSTNLISGSAIRLDGRDSGLPIGNIIINKLDLTHPDSVPSIAIMMTGADEVDNFNLLNLVSFGKFYNFISLYGIYTVTDPKEILTRAESSNAITVSNSYSSVFSSKNRTEGATYNLSGEFKPGMPEMTFIAENGSMSLQPAETDSILPYGTAGQKITLTKGMSVTLKRISNSEWLVTKAIGDITVS